MKLGSKYLKGFVSQTEIDSLQPEVGKIHSAMLADSGADSDFLGWVNLPADYDKDEFARIKQASGNIQQNSDILIVIGVGGSYLGARAVIEALKTQYYNSLPKDTPDIYFIGNSLSSTDLDSLIKICEGRNVSINVISKSGTTLEPALAFRVFRKLLEDKYGPTEAAKRIYVTTDRTKGALKELSGQNGYETFVVPDDIGGRYSVLTAVGLLPIAVAGINIDELMQGAAKAKEDMAAVDNIANRYAMYRNILYQKGYKVEFLTSFEPSLAQFGEWYKQLFGESEGKDGKGLLPNSANFTTDLHSVGQYLQEGPRHLFETIIRIKKPRVNITIPSSTDNIDGLDFLAGKSFSFANNAAARGTSRAHYDGGVPNIVLEIPELDEFNIGYLIYFFERACAMSGYLLGVNPFDQPGVEAYKSHTLELLNSS